MCQNVNTQQTVFVPSVFVEGKTKTRRRTGASFADLRRNLQREISGLMKEAIAHDLPRVQAAPAMKNPKKNRRPLWQGKLEKLSGAALRRCAADELEMDELTISESEADLNEYEVVIDSDLDLFERYGLDDDDRFEDDDCGYFEDDDFGYFELDSFFAALDRTPSRKSGISLWDLPVESRFYLLGYTSDPSLQAQEELDFEQLDFEQNGDELLAELLCGDEPDEYEAAYRRPRISNFIELPGGRPKRLKGSRHGSQNMSKRLRQYYGLLEPHSRRKERVHDALYRAYEEEVHSIDAEIREQERLAAKEAFRLRLLAEDQKSRTTGSVRTETVCRQSLSAQLGFWDREELNAHIRVVLLGKKAGITTIS